MAKVSLRGLARLKGGSPPPTTPRYSPTFTLRGVARRATTDAKRGPSRKEFGIDLKLGDEVPSELAPRKSRETVIDYRRSPSSRTGVAVSFREVIQEIRPEVQQAFSELTNYRRQLLEMSSHPETLNERGLTFLRDEGQGTLEEVEQNLRLIQEAVSRNEQHLVLGEDDPIHPLLRTAENIFRGMSFLGDTLGGRGHKFLSDRGLFTDEWIGSEIPESPIEMGATPGSLDERVRTAMWNVQRRFVPAALTAMRPFIAYPIGIVDFFAADFRKLAERNQVILSNALGGELSLAAVYKREKNRLGLDPEDALPIGHSMAIGLNAFIDESEPFAKVYQEEAEEAGLAYLPFEFSRAFVDPGWVLAWETGVRPLRALWHGRAVGQLRAAARQSGQEAKVMAAFDEMVKMAVPLDRNLVARTLARRFGRQATRTEIEGAMQAHIRQRLSKVQIANVLRKGMVQQPGTVERGVAEIIHQALETQKAVLKIENLAARGTRVARETAYRERRPVPKLPKLTGQDIPASFEVRVFPRANSSDYNVIRQLYRVFRNDTLKAGQKWGLAMDAFRKKALRAVKYRSPSSARAYALDMFRRMMDELILTTRLPAHERARIIKLMITSPDELLKSHPWLNTIDGRTGLSLLKGSRQNAETWADLARFSATDQGIARAGKQMMRHAENVAQRLWPSSRPNPIQIIFGALKHYATKIFLGTGRQIAKNFTGNELHIWGDWGFMLPRRRANLIREIEQIIGPGGEAPGLWMQGFGAEPGMIELMKAAGDDISNVTLAEIAAQRLGMSLPKKPMTLRQQVDIFEKLLEVSGHLEQIGGMQVALAGYRATANNILRPSAITPWVPKFRAAAHEGVPKEIEPLFNEVLDRAAYRSEQWLLEEVGRLFPEGVVDPHRYVSVRGLRELGGEADTVADDVIEILAASVSKKQLEGRLNNVVARIRRQIKAARDAEGPAIGAAGSIGSHIDIGPVEYQRLMHATRLSGLTGGRMARQEATEQFLRRYGDDAVDAYRFAVTKKHDPYVAHNTQRYINKFWDEVEAGTLESSDWPEMGRKVVDDIWASQNRNIDNEALRIIRENGGDVNELLEILEGFPWPGVGASPHATRMMVMGDDILRYQSRSGLLDNASAFRREWKEVFGDQFPAPRTISNLKVWVERNPKSAHRWMNHLRRKLQLDDLPWMEWSDDAAKSLDDIAEEIALGADQPRTVELPEIRPPKDITPGEFEAMKLEIEMGMSSPPPSPAEAAEQLGRETIDQIRIIQREALELYGKPLPGEAGALERVLTWLDDEYLPIYRLGKQVSLNAGSEARKFALLDYSSRNLADTLLSYGYPWHYWATRTGLNWSVRTMENPSLVSSYFLAQRQVRRANENVLWENPATGKVEKGLPDYWMDTVPLPFPMPFFGAVRFNPFIFHPLYNFMFAIDRFPDQFARYQRSLGTPSALLAAMWTSSPMAAWIGAEEAIQTFQTPEGREVRIGPITPPGQLLWAATGLDLDPISMAIRALGREAGKEVEGGSAFGPTYWGRVLVTQLRSGEITPAQYNEAMNLRSGEIFEAAAEEARSLKGLTLVAGIFTGLPLRATRFLGTEVLIQEATEEYNEIWELPEGEGRSRAFRDFHEENEWYSSWLRRYNIEDRREQNQATQEWWIEHNDMQADREDAIRTNFMENPGEWDSLNEVRSEWVDKLGDHRDIGLAAGALITMSPFTKSEGQVEKYLEKNIYFVIASNVPRPDDYAKQIDLPIDQWGSQEWDTFNELKDRFWRTLPDNVEALPGITDIYDDVKQQLTDAEMADKIPDLLPILERMTDRKMYDATRRSNDLPEEAIQEVYQEWLGEANEWYQENMADLPWEERNLGEFFLKFQSFPATELIRRLRDEPAYGGRWTDEELREMATGVMMPGIFEDWYAKDDRDEIAGRLIMEYYSSLSKAAKKQFREAAEDLDARPIGYKWLVQGRDRYETWLDLLGLPSPWTALDESLQTLFDMYTRDARGEGPGAAAAEETGDGDGGRRGGGRRRGRAAPTGAQALVSLTQMMAENPESAGSLMQDLVAFWEQGAPLSPATMGYLRYLRTRYGFATLEELIAHLRQLWTDEGVYMPRMNIRRDNQRFAMPGIT